MKNYIFKLFTIMTVVGVLFSSCDGDDETLNPKAGEITPTQGAANELLTLTGSDLSDIRTIVFEAGNVQADFNPNFNTDKAILFRVPTDAVPGEQNVIMTNKKGATFTVPFNVLGFANITKVSNYNFSEGTEITLTGKNLDDVTQVVFSGTTTEIEILGKTATTLTLRFPASDLIQSTLDITNEAGVAKTTQSFVAIDNAFHIFTDGYADGYQDASWGDGGVVTTDEFKSGTSSVYKNYAAGNWHLMGFGWTNTANQDFKYLSFWIKGAAAQYDLYIQSQQSPSGWDTFSDFNKITVPANEWTYFKIPVDNLKLWANGAEWNQLVWRIQGPDGADARFYLDDVIFIK